MSPRRAKALGEESSPGALRRHLIAATQRLIAAHGAAGLTTRQIAREAEVADGVLYNHFHGKDDLVLTAMGERGSALVGDFLAAVPTPGTGTIEENLAALTRAAQDMQAGLVPLVAGLVGHPHLFHELFARLHGEHGPQDAVAATVAYLRAEQELGRASREVDAFAVGQLIFGAAQLRALVVLGDIAAVEIAAGPTAGEPDAVVTALVRAVRPA